MGGVHGLEGWFELLIDTVVAEELGKEKESESESEVIVWTTALVIVEVKYRLRRFSPRGSSTMMTHQR